MTKFGFSGEDLIKHWGIKWFELINYVRISDGDLQPYNSRGNMVIDPSTEHGRRIMGTFKNRIDPFVFKEKLPSAILNLKKEDDSILMQHMGRTVLDALCGANNCEAEYFKMPKDPVEDEAFIQRAKGWIFRTDDVLSFEKRHGLDQSAKHTSTNSEKKVFPCKPGTKWKDVEITLKSGDAVMIKTPEGSRRYHYSELCMKDKRKGDIPTMSWELLMYFCKYSGRISSTTSVDRILSLRFRNLSKSISKLNKKLQNISGIPESFCKKYDKRDGWVAKCIFNDNTFSA